MIGKIIDMNKTDAFISFKDGTTMDIGVARIPKNSKIGDTVDIDLTHNTKMTNDKMFDLF